jgi:exopolysaccharide biosynthesis polyprenyl glycosylphosphotransferase
METSTARPATLQLKISERRTLLKIGDGVAIFIAVLGALIIWSFVDQSQLEFNANFLLDNFWWFPILMLLWLTLASASDFYNLRLSANFWNGFRRLLLIEIQLVTVYVVIFFFSPRDTLPRLFILYYSLLSFALILLWRAIWWSALARRFGLQRRALVVGAGWAARTMVKTLKEEATDEYEIVGLVAAFDPQDTLSEAYPLYGTDGEPLPKIVQRLGVSEVILAYGSQLPGAIFQGVLDCYEQGVTIVPMALLYEQITGRVPIEHVGIDDWAVVLPLEPESIFNPFMPLKRLMDVGISLVGFLGFVLALPFIALVIRLESPGPIFYTQERVGKGGKNFKIIKLRSMRADAEKAGPQWAGKDDPRVTRMGRIMRKTRLDELPQFINILRGDMSLVGPRPERPFFVDQLSEEIPFYRTRHLVRPGATGWAQVRYPYGNSVEDSLIKLQYDLYYIRHQSLALDLQIIIRTIGKMISFAGT